MAKPETKSVTWIALEKIAQELDRLEDRMGSIYDETKPPAGSEIEGDMSAIQFDIGSAGEAVRYLMEKVK